MMNRNRSILIALGLFWFGMGYTNLVHALALGKVDVQSTLNERLKAEIKLYSVPKDKVDDIRVILGSSKAFQRAKVARPFYLTRLIFKVKTKKNGDPFILISSRQAIKEPIIDLILEVGWLTGRTQKRYTMLIDPGYVQ